MVLFLLPCATPGLASIAAWCGSGTTAMVICVNTAAHPRRAEPAVRGDISSVWQVIHGTPSAPRISAQRITQFDGHCTSNLLTNNKLRQRYSRCNSPGGLCSNTITLGVLASPRWRGEAPRWQGREPPRTERHRRRSHCPHTVGGNAESLFRKTRRVQSFSHETPRQIVRG